MVGGSILLPLPEVLPIRKGQHDVVRFLWDPHILQSALHHPDWEIPSGKPVISLFSFIRSTTSLTSKRGMGAQARTQDVTREAHCKDSLSLFEVHQFLAVWIHEVNPRLPHVTSLLKVGC